MCTVDGLRPRYPTSPPRDPAAPGLGVPEHILRMFAGFPTQCASSRVPRHRLAAVGSPRGKVCTASACVHAPCCGRLAQQEGPPRQVKRPGVRLGPCGFRGPWGPTARLYMPRIPAPREPPRGLSPTPLGCGSFGPLRGPRPACQCSRGRADELADWERSRLQGDSDWPRLSGVFARGRRQPRWPAPSHEE